MSILFELNAEMGEIWQARMLDTLRRLGLTKKTKYAMWFGDGLDGNYWTVEVE